MPVIDLAFLNASFINKSHSVVQPIKTESLTSANAGKQYKLKKREINFKYFIIVLFYHGDQQHQLSNLSRACQSNISLS